MIGVTRANKCGYTNTLTRNRPDMYTPSLMTDKELKRELCGPAHNAKQCVCCECIGWCEYGNEAVRRYKARIL